MLYLTTEFLVDLDSGLGIAECWVLNKLMGIVLMRHWEMDAPYWELYSRIDNHEVEWLSEGNEPRSDIEFRNQTSVSDLRSVLGQLIHAHITQGSDIRKIYRNKIFVKLQNQLNK